MANQTLEKHDISRLLRSEVTHSNTAPSGVFPPCFTFCNLGRKTVNRKIEVVGNCETEEAQEAIKNAAKILKDEEFQTKYNNVDFIAKEVKYPHSCKRDYINRAKRETGSFSIRSEYAETRDAHSKAFES